MTPASKRVAIVTGGTSGIGLETARQLSANGFLVAITGLVPAEGAVELLSGFSNRAIYIRSDLSDVGLHREVVLEVERKLGPISCLVNNAGIGPVARKDFLELTPENFDVVLDINLRGTVFFTQKVVAAMLSGPSTETIRSIVNVGSVSAVMASPDRMEYCLSKAGLSAFTANLAVRLAAYSISVFEVRPGIIRTEMTAKASANYDDLIARGLVPSHRWGEPGDVANAVVELASGSFIFATGSTIHVDGALSIPRL